MEIIISAEIQMAVIQYGATLPTPEKDLITVIHYQETKVHVSGWEDVKFKNTIRHQVVLTEMEGQLLTFRPFVQQLDQAVPTIVLQEKLVLQQADFLSWKL